MAVPDNTTFSLQDVVNEINPTTDDLQDCINDADPNDYDITYYTSPATSLLEFRNYQNSFSPPPSTTPRLVTNLSNSNYSWKRSNLTEYDTTSKRTWTLYNDTSNNFDIKIRSTDIPTRDLKIRATLNNPISGGSNLAAYLDNTGSPPSPTEQIDSNQQFTISSNTSITVTWLELDITGSTTSDFEVSLIYDNGTNWVPVTLSGGSAPPV